MAMIKIFDPLSGKTTERVIPASWGQYSRRSYGIEICGIFTRDAKDFGFHPASRVQSLWIHNQSAGMDRSLVVQVSEPDESMEDGFGIPHIYFVYEELI